MWRRKAQKSLQMNLAWRRIQQVGTSDDLSYALIMVVCNHRQMVRDEAISPPDNKIARIKFQALAQHTLKTVCKCYGLGICQYPDGNPAAHASIATGAGINSAQRATARTGKFPAGTSAGVCLTGIY
jgi:hypothetical protein